MCEVNEKELNQEVELDEDIALEDIEEGYIDSEEQMGLIAVQEELKRIDIQENPKSKTSKETKSSSFYKDSMITIETIGEAFQKLLGYGVDYNNALALANNLATNDANLKISRIQQANQEQNQI
jgi:hypothetical protein